MFFAVFVTFAVSVLVVFLIEFATFLAAVTGAMTKELRLFFGAEVEGEFILLDETNDSVSRSFHLEKGYTGRG